MRYHSSLIKHYISIKDTPEEIAKKLILKTCEVEEIIKRDLPEDVVIGKVINVRKHPQADKLVVCDVDCWARWIYTICTWGENVVLNSFVPVALPGCYLPDIDLKIEPRTMRGEPSNGMICSKGEIGINEDEDQHWIWTLQYDSKTPASDITQPADFNDITDADCGIALKDKYPRLEAYIFDVDNKTVTNRPDLTGHFWLAWELQAMYANNAATHILWDKLHTMMREMPFTSASQLSTLGKQHTIPVTVTCDAVAVYTGIHLENCTTQPSTFLTRTILRDCGSTPRLNRVDASNLFMMLTGQPVHFFDADSIVWWVTVRYAKQGEEFVDLMDGSHVLTEKDIVIADDEKVLALAGIIWWKSSAITEKTKNIFVEIAHFDAVTIRKTGTRLALRTDAELRYEKQINPQFTTRTLPMFLDFLLYAKKDLGEYTMWWLSHYTAPDYNDQPLDIAVDWEKISQAIYGDNSLSPETAKGILTQLGYIVHENSVVVPWWRWSNDMHWLHDITEEVIRIHGYEAVEGKPLTAVLTTPKNEWTVAIQRAFEEVLVRDFRMTQVETYPWLHEKYIAPFGTNTNNLLSLQNPTAPELTYLRDNMIYGLLDAVTKNAKIYDTINIFDMGKVWSQEENTRKENHVCGMVFYDNKKTRWRQDDSRFTTKQALEALGIATLKGYTIRLEPTTKPYFHTKKQATIYADDVIVWHIGSLHPSIMQLAKLDEYTSITYAQLSLTTIASLPKKQYIPSYETLQDQIISRDFSFVVDANTERKVLEDAIRSINEVSDIAIFDIYAGDTIPEGKKAIAFSCKIRWDGTLQTDQINAIMDRVIKACEATWATLR